MTAAGAPSGRSDLHFAEMFEANLGKERAAPLDVHITFPESFEDRIEATG